MGVTIHYRGKLTDLARIEDFEDRLVDLALEIGAQVRIWRTWADDNPARMVRGVILLLKTRNAIPSFTGRRTCSRA